MDDDAEAEFATSQTHLLSRGKCKQGWPRGRLSFSLQHALPVAPEGCTPAAALELCIYISCEDVNHEQVARMRRPRGPHILWSRMFVRQYVDF